MRIDEMKEKDDDELLARIKATLSSFPILKEIYDEEFCLNLIRKKENNDNYLLWLLVSGTDYSKITWETISKFLMLLVDADSIPHFRDKLGHRKETIFHSFQTELELAGYYKERGYDVELEPKIPDTDQNPDFKIEKDKTRVFFEVGNLFIQELIEMENVDSQIHDRFNKIEEPFRFGFAYNPFVLKTEHLKPLQVFLKKKFAELEKSKELSFPLSFHFPDEKDSLVEVKVFGREEKNGRFSGIVSTFGLPRGSNNFRMKISKKISQLPKGEKNVIVVELGHPYYDEEDCLDALFGDKIIVVNMKDGSTQDTRGKEKLFRAEKNTRLSAVINYKKIFRYSNFHVWKTVIHNPYAFNPINPDFFEDDNVTQFVPIKTEKGVHMEWLKKE